MDTTQALIERFVGLSRRALGENLTGVYLHGSAAMGCYHPATSDLDFIVVVRQAMTDAARRAFMEGILPLDAATPGKGVEMSVITRDVCMPFVYPTPFELHYSRRHTDWYRRDPGDYLRRMRGTDKDLAAHFTVIRSRGVCLFGAPIEALFAPVPKADYVDSIWSDVCGAREEIEGDPVYLTLNLARVLAYLEDGQVLSKAEGGAWALARLPEVYRPLIAGALDAYGGAAVAPFDPALARRYAQDMLGRVSALRELLFFDFQA